MPPQSTTTRNGRTATRTVTVTDDDSAAPVITLGGSQGNENDGQDQTFTWNVADAGSGLGSVASSNATEAVCRRVTT